MKKLLYGILFLLVVISGMPVSGQTPQTVTGTISDNGGFLPGVNVYEKDVTTNGTVTTETGKLTLKIKGNARILVFSAIGFLKKEVNVTGKTTIKVTLDADVKGLEEVVVLGYGQTKKITNTGAISAITGQQIRQSPSASLQNSLAGRLPGFFSQQRGGQPGKDGAAFQIRGISTFQGTTTPLIIVDDIEVTVDQINQIDPNEIESLSILKDASTTAVYGVRGANGVVVIKTRRGQAGKPQLTFRSETGLAKSTLNFDTNDGYTTLKLLNEWTTEQYLDPAIAYPNFFGGNNLEHYRLNDDPYKYPAVDWWKELTKSYSLQSRINFDISGGSQKAKYFVSLGYLSQGGIYKDFSKGTGYNSNYNYDRYNFRSNVDLDPNKNLHLRFDLSGRFGIINSPNDAPWNGGAATLQYLWNGQLSSFGYPVYNADGSLGGSTSKATKPNPVANLRYSGYNRDYNNNLSFVTQAVQKLDFITEGLSANGLVSFASDYNFTRSLTRNSTEILTYYFDPNSGGYLPVTPNLYRNGKLNRGGFSTGTNRLLNIQASLNYNKSFGNHNLSSLFMLNQATKTEDIYSTDTKIISAGEPYNVRGVVGRVSYNYKQKYLFDVNGAYNGSDKFSSSKRFQFFPSASIGWNISEEGFFKNKIKFVDGLKLRASYGIVGNDGIGTKVYSYDKTYVTGSGKPYLFGDVNNTTSSGLIEPTLANNEITWETQRDADIGLDLKMFKGKLSLTADYFKKRRSDILTQRSSIAAAFGAALPYQNLGIVDNQGYEIELTYRGTAAKNKVSYFVNAQVSHAENKVVFRDEGTARYPWLGLTGKPVGALFAYQDAGLYQSLADLYNSPRLVTATPLSNLSLGGVKLKDLNGDGIIDQNDLGYIGTNQPQYIMGLSFGFSYKGFDVSTLFQGAADYFVNIQRGVINYSRPENQSVPYNLGRWTPVTGDDATFPVLAGSDSQNSVYSTYWTKRGDYVRWKNVEIGYKFPVRVAKKLGLNTIRVYANGYNLGLLYTALPVFIDPESITGTVNSTNIGDTNEYPQQRIYNFGIQISL
ncbi:TonB-dependent receptor [Pedobacter sp. PAMC26386]|nr:TonB-dependent receptor [Pedobacter sp. PAMC26386]